MVSVLPYARAARPRSEKPATIDGAYLKDYGAAQEFGFCKNGYEKAV
jgi:hypothetical protein